MTLEEAKRCIETLAAEVLVLRHRLDALERQRFEIHEHHHYPSVPTPNIPPWPQPDPWEPGRWRPDIVWCNDGGRLGA